mmetsp:Transcript_108304/g.316818  ORF Transcript_108304/g.316818 Transcript_108304/m.316818 type:complete len:455 (+) Transcript_108304:799-2163(+)
MHERQELLQRGGPLLLEGVEADVHRLAHHRLRRRVAQRVQQAPDVRLLQRRPGHLGDGPAGGGDLLLAEEAEELEELARLHEARLVHVHADPELRLAVLGVRVAQPVQHAGQLELPQLTLPRLVEALEGLHVLGALLLGEALRDPELLQEVQDLLEHQAGGVSLHHPDDLLDDVWQHCVAHLHEQAYEVVQRHYAIAVGIVLGKEVADLLRLFVLPLPHREQELQLVDHAVPVHVKASERGLRLGDADGVAKPTHDARHFLSGEAARPCLVVAVKEGFYLRHLRRCETRPLVHTHQSCVELPPVQLHRVVHTHLVQQLGHSHGSHGKAEIPEDRTELPDTDVPGVSVVRLQEARPKLAISEVVERHCDLCELSKAQRVVTGDLPQALLHQVSVEALVAHDLEAPAHTVPRQPTPVLVLHAPEYGHQKAALQDLRHLSLFCQCSQTGRVIFVWLL